MIKNCKHCKVGPLQRSVIGMLFVGIALAWTILLAQIDVEAASPEHEATTQDVPQSDPAKQPPPELSLRSLYHPEEKFDFDGTLPATHWIDSDPAKLLVKRDQKWNQVDLASGEESTWPVADQLASHLRALEGVDEQAAKSAANDAVSKMKKSIDTVLIPIGKGLAIGSATGPARWLTRDASAWRNATIDPTFRRVAYTREGDLFVVDAKTSRSLQLTNDGSETLLDGVLDWTYQEEIFGRGNYRGFWFSPDGQWMAMLRIDISGVEPYFLPSASSERGRGVVRRYPKAGDPIPHAQLYVWDLREADAGKFPPPKLIEQSTPQDQRIVTGVWWHPHQLGLLYAVSDRLQTWRELRVVQADVFSGSTEQRSRLLFREESPTWVEPPKAPGWLKDGSLIWHSELPTGREQLYHVSPSGQVITPATPEDFDVNEFSVQSDGSSVMVTGDVNRGTVERHVYAVQTDSSGKPRLKALTQRPGWHSASFGPDGSWFVDRFSSPTQPSNLIVRSTDLKHNRLLDSSTLKVRRIVEPTIFVIETPDGAQLPAMLIRPASASQQQPCPVVIEVYGGPRAPVVTTRWAGTRSLYRELLARRGIATLVVDNRSSAGRGIADTWKIRGRVGELEFQDLMNAVDWLRDQSWVDSKKLAIRGWSFGGFLTLYAMTHSDVFAAGIAGGSVTDWKEYDAFYTERYMGLPRENEEGYRITAPVRAADKLVGRVLLIHGESDDNVHPSGTMRMAEALQKAGKDFRLMIYPGAAHAVRDRHQLWHMTQMTDAFLTRELLGNRSSKATD